MIKEKSTELYPKTMEWSWQKMKTMSLPKAKSACPSGVIGKNGA